MAERGVAFGASAAKRIVDTVRARESTPRDQRGRLRPGLSDDHRFFELTEELSGGAGSTADVKWLWWNTEDDDFVDSGETGEVLDHLSNAWGLQGERGEARFLGGKWVVIGNPGQPVYQGTAAANILSSHTIASINVDIDGATRSVTANVPTGAVSSGKKYASGGIVFIAHSRGAFRIVSFVSCEVAV